MKWKQAKRRKRKEREESYSLENYLKQMMLLLTEVSYGVKVVQKFKIT